MFKFVNKQLLDSLYFRAYVEITFLLLLKIIPFAVVKIVLNIRFSFLQRL